MKVLQAWILFGSLLMCFACERPSEPDGPAPKSTTERGSPTSQPKPSSSPLSILRKLTELPAENQAATLAAHIYDVSDGDLPRVLESVLSHSDPVVKRQLLTTVFEETQIRPPITRLPTLLELARQPEIEPSLRVSIMAELGATLRAEHGESWSDWSLAIEEHLAETEGLLRVE